jgi:succinate dehydrogenase flavin-adding protein (antitoxin of CptAB toxin-antitoxin module)
MKELDVLLGRYAAATLPQADAAERRLLARLLDRPDPELAGYLMGGEAPPEAEMAALVMRITSPEIRPAEWPKPQETAHDRAVPMKAP